MKGGVTDMKYQRYYKVNADIYARRHNTNQFGLPKTKIPAQKAFWFFTAITASFFISQAIITIFVR